MDSSLFLSFLAASIILTVMPGPDNLLVMTESIAGGRKKGIALSLGLCLGILVHTSAAATGLSMIIKNSRIIYSLIGYFGAVYLFYLAYISLKETRNHEAQVPNVENESLNTIIKRGFFLNLLNPKVSLFFIALLPQFITENGFSISNQMFVLGISFMIQALIIFIAMAILSGSLNKLFSSKRFLVFAKCVKAIVLFVLALLLILVEL